MYLNILQAPVRTKVNRGILSRMSNAVELARKGQHRVRNKDCFYTFSVKK